MSQPKDDKPQQQPTAERKAVNLEDCRRVAGNWVQSDGYVLCPGVNCRCADQTFCPLHGPKREGQ